MEKKTISKASLKLDDAEISLDVITGSEGEQAIDISRIRKETGIITLDPGFANTGAFLSSLAYCLWLARRERSFGEFARAQDASAGALPMNYGLAFATGLMWYGQFLLYGLGYVRMGQFKFSSWAIHMILLILFSSVIGIAMKEWHGRSARTKLALAVALSITLGAVLLITYGNYLGQ